MTYDTCGQVNIMAANFDPKDILKKLSFLRGIVAFLVPILIAVVATVLFLATLVLGARLRSNVEKTSVQPAKQISALMGQIGEAARAKQMEPYVNAYAKDANTIENIIMGSTQRELLSYRIFPDTNERTTLLYEEFSRKYRSGLDETLRSLRAGLAPARADITAALRKAPQAGIGGYGELYGGNPYARDDMMANAGASLYGDYMQGQIPTALMTPAQRKIVDTVCLDKAQAAGVYVSPVDVAGYMYWTEWKFQDRDAAYRDCWYWQLGYWIIQDVMTTIQEMNKGSNSILDAPVKRLMNVNFVLGRMAGRSMRRPGRGGRTSDKTGENPTYVTSAKDAMTVPCTGRYCNDEIDVVHFDVRVVVEAKSAMAFMKQLCSAKTHRFNGWKNEGPAQTLQHNQITILESSTIPVDPQGFEHALYRYGDAPAVELDLICEYLFDKPAYEGQKPEQVKEDITSALEGAAKKR
jgi:hypothetical protein